MRGLSVGVSTSETAEQLAEDVDVGGLSVGAGTSSDLDEAPSMLLNVVPHRLHSP